MIYRAVSLWQPWASLIAWGWKDVEVRTHGLLSILVGEDFAVHGAKRWDSAGAAFLRGWLPGAVLRRQVDGDGTTLGGALRTARRWPRGRVLCIARGEEHGELTVANERDAWCECAGMMGLFVKDIRRVKGADGWAPKARGRQGIWNWEAPPGMALRPLVQRNPLAEARALPTAPDPRPDKAWWHD